MATSPFPYSEMTVSGQNAHRPKCPQTKTPWVKRRKPKCPQTKTLPSQNIRDQNALGQNKNFMAAKNPDILKWKSGC